MLPVAPVAAALQYVVYVYTFLAGYVDDVTFGYNGPYGARNTIGRKLKLYHQGQHWIEGEI